ncbi:MAG TPA: vWA domain-containing protein [Gammaproteobacteria bacterium]|nr:vWA domain-containing protein [Gammaproteobacteria bacterium]
MRAQSAPKSSARAALFAAALIVGLVVALLVAPGSAGAQVTRPLTVEGKRALYQRVIAVPGAGTVASAGAPLRLAQPVAPFTVFYVYEREQIGGREWLRVGLDSTGDIQGWLPAEQGVEWRQTLTVGFKDPANQPRVPLFADREQLKTIAENNEVSQYGELRQRAVDGDVGDSGVIAVQPDGFVDIRRNFYLVPILNHEDVLVGDYSGRLLEVASVPLDYPDPYRAGIVFVIDTTVSMQPYIEQTREIMRGIYDQIDAAGLSDRVAYGLVGFRDNTDAAPGLDYVSRVFADLTGSGEEFLQQVGSVAAATASSQGFNEDAYAGVNQALNEIDWSNHFARYVVLITDAGPRPGSDPLSATGLDTAGLRARLTDLGVSAWAIHLKTPTGARENDHAAAEQEYRALSRVPDIGEFYYPVATGDVADFGSALETLMTQLTDQVRTAASGFQPLNTSDAAGGSESELAAFQQRVARLGYALRLDYQQQQAGSETVPALFNAYMLDRDLTVPGELAVDVRVLLTRDQLSDLHDVLAQILVRAEEGALAPQNFLDELRSLSAIVSRDPEAVETAGGAAASLADLGYMREYIEGLPYQSEVMNLDLANWQTWTAVQQFEFINSLDSKVAYYRALHDNLDLWVSLDRGPIDGDSVYPLLLEALP